MIKFDSFVNREDAKVFVDTQYEYFGEGSGGMTVGPNGVSNIVVIAGYRAHNEDE